MTATLNSQQKTIVGAVPSKVPSSAGESNHSTTNGSANPSVSSSSGGDNSLSASHRDRETLGMPAGAEGTDSQQRAIGEPVPREDPIAAASNSSVASQRSDVTQRVTAGGGGQDSQQTIRDPKSKSTAPAAPTLPEGYAHPTAVPHMRSGMALWDPLLQTLASGLDDIESARIAQANRYRILTAVSEDSDGEVRGFGLDGGHPAVAALSIQLSTLVELEKGMTKALAKQLKSHPLHPWIKAQSGLGDKQVARLLAAIRDPYWNDLHDRPRTVSELWAFCGLHVLPVAGQIANEAQGGLASDGANRGGADTSHSFSDVQPAGAGVAPARRRGQKLNWNNEARTRIYVIAESCMKNRNSPYRVVYDDGREKYAESVHAVPCAQCGKKGQPAAVATELRDGHKHARAMRLVMKAVLKDLWIESRRIYTTTSKEN